MSRTAGTAARRFHARGRLAAQVPLNVPHQAPTSGAQLLGLRARREVVEAGASFPEGTPAPSPPGGARGGQCNSPLVESIGARGFEPPTPTVSRDAGRFQTLLGATFLEESVTEAYWSVHPVTPEWYAKWYASPRKVGRAGPRRETPPHRPNPRPRLRSHSRTPRSKSRFTCFQGSWYSMGASCRSASAKYVNASRI
jgi:hypothetical protein